jgi:anti-sigma B factor antagonist
MTIEQKMVGAVVVLELIGPLMLGDGDQLLRDKVHSLVFEGNSEFVLDLHRLTRIDSTGLGAIIAAYTTVTRNGGRIVLVNLTARVTDLMAITKLLTIFETADSVTAAVVSFSGPKA